MPELPEVETVMRGLAPVMSGARFIKVEARRPDLRIALPIQFATRLKGACVQRLHRRAKYILVELDSGDTLALHLGMSGSMRIQAGKLSPTGRFYFARGAKGAHDHVVFDMSNGARIFYNDPRRFGSMRLLKTTTIASDPAFAGLGEEPLDERFDAARLAALLAGRATSLKTALLDQRLIAGLGNIYVCEALHRAALSPLRIAGSMSLVRGQPARKAAELVDAIKSVLRAAIAAGGSSLRDHRQIDGALGAFQHDFAVYDRKGRPCPRPACVGVFERIVQYGRSTFYCPVCQR